MSYTIQSNSLELHSNTVQQSNLTKKIFIVVVVVVAVMFLVLLQFVQESVMINAPSPRQMSSLGKSNQEGLDGP